jgi:hypothetical protein
MNQPVDKTITELLAEINEPYLDPVAARTAASLEVRNLLTIASLPGFTQQDLVVKRMQELVTSAEITNHERKTLVLAIRVIGLE